MSNPNAPVKTPLGHQELRHRTQRLGQRHRTVLLLVDGRRPVAEVLSMALQAGAQTAHFEELVRLGMVELPAPVAPPELLPEPPPEPLADSPSESPDESPVVQLRTEPAPEAAVTVAPPVAAPSDAGPAALAAPDTLAQQEPPANAAHAAPAPPLANPETAEAAEHRLDAVRRLLIDTLRRDTLLQRVFAPARVRAARTQEELIGLVWAIERERAHVRRKRGQLLNLQRARDLLGMGNTVVAEDSLPWTPPEE